ASAAHRAQAASVPADARPDLLGLRLRDPLGYVHGCDGCSGGRTHVLRLHVCSSLLVRLDRSSRVSQRRDRYSAPLIPSHSLDAPARLARRKRSIWRSEMSDDLYRSVTDRIVAALEKGTPPWVRPWSQVTDAVPINAQTQRQYRGINFALLSLEANSNDY